MELMDRLVNQIEMQRAKLRSLPIWSKSDYINNQANELCLESHDGDLITNVDDYFCLACMDEEDMKMQIEDASMIPVYTKTDVTFNGKSLRENYFLGVQYGLNENNSIELESFFDDFANSLNEMHAYFIKKEQVAWLDLSREVEKYCINKLQVNADVCV